jgi:2-oxoglutarate dehydrogenase E2 component (dihydrolipoamide succinyltransferase)
MTVEVRIPVVGESVTEAVITRWLKAEGDRVEKDEPMAELETDKVDVELPSPASGVLASIVAREGDTVPVGGVIGTIEEGDGAGAGEASRREPPAREATAKKPPAKGPSTKAPATKERPEKSPAKEPPAKEPPAKEPPGEQPPVEEPPPRERPIEEPPSREAPRREPPRPEPARPEPPPSRELPPPSARERPPATPGRREESVPLTAIRRRIAKRLVEAQLETALTTTFNDGGRRSSSATASGSG